MVEAVELQERFRDRNKFAHTTEELLEQVAGYPVKTVIAFYPKEKVPKEWIPDLEDVLIKSFIVGSAWPNNVGWELCFAEDTIFCTKGFNEFDPLRFFCVGQNFELNHVEPSIINGINEDSYYAQTITYSDISCLDIMTLKTKKPN